MEKKIFISTKHDPYLNQAIESALFFNPSDDFILFLYVNSPSVVIGRNQNPWKELNLESSSDVKFLRRISGGGTVYHDLNNLNFAFIYNEGMTSVEDNLKMIVKSFKSYGIDLNITARKDLFYQDYKVSGNAFYRRGKKRLHHGTLLIDVKTHDLWKVLNFNHDHYKCRSIPSVKSDIINLKDVNSSLNIEAAIQSISHVFSGHIMDCEAYLRIHFDKLNHYKSKYSSQLWLYEETPDFEYTYQNDIYKVKNGYIVESNNKQVINKLFNEKLIKKEVENVTRII